MYLILRCSPLTQFCLQQMAPPVQVKTKSCELLDRMSGKGLAVSYKFTRTISIFSPKMASIELSFVNNGDKPLTDIHIGEKVSLDSGINVYKLQRNYLDSASVF